MFVKQVFLMLEASHDRGAKGLVAGVVCDADICCFASGDGVHGYEVREVWFDGECGLYRVPKTKLGLGAFELFSVVGC